MQYNLDSTFKGFSGIYPTAIQQEFMVQFWDQFPFTQFTGSSNTSPIIERPKEKGNNKTFSVRIPKIYGGDYKNVRKNFDKRVAYAQTLDSSFDEMSYDYFSHVMSYENIKWLSEGQPLIADIPSYAMTDIARMGALHTQQMFFDSICTMYPLAVNGMMPRTERAVAGTGVWAYANGAGLAAQVEVVAPVADADQHRLSMKHLRKVIRALRAKNGEDQIHPGAVKTIQGFPAYEFHYFMSRAAYEWLAIDPEYQATMTQRGAILQYQPNAVEGADYKGKAEGLNLWVVDFLDNYSFQAAGGGVNTAWGFAMGGAAFTIGFHELDQVTKDVINGDDTAILTSHLIKGVKCLTFPCQAAIKDPAFDFGANPNSRIESGIIHSFTRIV